MGTTWKRDFFEEGTAGVDLEDHQPTSPGSWEVVVGANTWPIDITPLPAKVQITGTVGRYQVGFLPTLVDSIGRVQLSIPSATSVQRDGYCGVILQANADQSGYLAGVGSEGLVLMRRVAGTESKCAQSSWAWQASGTLALTVYSGAFLQLLVNNSVQLSYTDTEPASVTGFQAGLFVVNSATSGSGRGADFAAHDLHFFTNTPAIGTVDDRRYEIAVHEFEDLTEQRQLAAEDYQATLTLQFTAVSSSRMAELVNFVASRGGSYEPFEITNPNDSRAYIVRLDRGGFTIDRSGPLGFSASLRTKILEQL